MYLLLGATVLTGAIAVVRRPAWRSRALAVAVVIAAAALSRDLRPGALLLMTAGLAVGVGLYAASASKRTFVITALVAALAVGLIVSRVSVEDRLVGGLEAAAKTHSGHVFTVGHSYKLLDAGFYVNPRTPVSSTLTLTRAEAARFVIRAVVSFVMVPVPWQLQSARELAYLPEQIAWYGLILLLPIGVVAGYRRDRFVTCMLVGYALPTAIALALTNGNVGTLLRLRGLVVPYFLWISAVGFFAALGTLGQENKMRLIDDDGRVFGRVNLFDAAADRVRGGADPGRLRHLPAVPHPCGAHLIGDARAHHQRRTARRRRQPPDRQAEGPRQRPAPDAAGLDRRRPVARLRVRGSELGGRAGRRSAARRARSHSLRRCAGSGAAREIGDD